MFSSLFQVIRLDDVVVESAVTKNWGARNLTIKTYRLCYWHEYGSYVRRGVYSILGVCAGCVVSEEVVVCMDISRRFVKVEMFLMEEVGLRM